MALSTQRAVSDGTLTYLAISIDYLDREHISVFYDEVAAGSDTWAWVGTTTKAISFPTAIAEGVEVLIVRSTERDSVLNNFSDGAAFLDSTMDENFLQMLYISQEAAEGAGTSDIYNTVNMHGNKLTNIGTATASTDAVSLGQATAVTAASATAAAASVVEAQDIVDTASATVIAAGTAQVSAATTQAQASAASAAAAVVTLNQVAAIYDDFDDRYLGPKSSNPSVDNDGNALVVGALYFNTSPGSQGLRMYTDSGWALPAGSASALACIPADGFTSITVQGALEELGDHAATVGNAHGLTLANLGIANVENKSSSTIRSEITSANVKVALGYTPYNPAEVLKITGGTDVGPDEGGQIELATAVNSILQGGSVIIDVYQNWLRIFESGSPNRGVHLPLKEARASAGLMLYGPRSHTLPGFATLTGGLLLEWGYWSGSLAGGSGTVEVTLPATAPNAIMTVQVTISGDPSATADNGPLAVKSTTTSTITIRNTGDQIITGFLWFVIAI